MILDDYIVYYLNLDKCIQKKNDVENELLKVFDENLIVRFPAILHKKGQIGCTLSHIKILENALLQEKNNIFVFEDDVEFTYDVNLFKEHINKINDYNIIILSYNIGFHEKILHVKNLGNHLGLIKNTRSTAGYLINKSFIPTLLNVWKAGLERMKTKGIPYNEVDRTWNILETPENKFYCFIPRPIKIKSAFSSIAKKIVSPEGYCFLALSLPNDSNEKDIYTCFNYEIFNNDDLQDLNNLKIYLEQKHKNIDYLCVFNNYDPKKINIDSLFSIFFDISYRKYNYVFDNKYPNIKFYRFNNINNNICDKSKELSFQSIYII